MTCLMSLNVHKVMTTNVNSSFLKVDSSPIGDASRMRLALLPEESFKFKIVEIEFRRKSGCLIFQPLEHNEQI